MAGAGSIVVSPPNYLLAIQSKAVHSTFQSLLDVMASSNRPHQFQNFIDKFTDLFIIVQPEFRNSFIRQMIDRCLPSHVEFGLA